MVQGVQVSRGIRAEEGVEQAVAHRGVFQGGVDLSADDALVDAFGTHQQRAQRIQGERRFGVESRQRQIIVDQLRRQDAVGPRHRAAYACETADRLRDRQCTNQKSIGGDPFCGNSLHPPARAQTALGVTSACAGGRWARGCTRRARGGY